LAGQLQPRFNLVVTHAGIDDRELGALDDGTATTSSRVEEPRAAPSCITARPIRLAAFSSFRFVGWSRS